MTLTRLTALQGCVAFFDTVGEVFKRQEQQSEKWVLSELKRHIGKQSNFCYAHSLKRAFNEERRLMNCPYCVATTTKKRTKKTKLGYTTFFCPHCRCTFNERTGTPFNYLEFPTDIVLLAVLWRLRYKLSLRDIAELFLARLWVHTRSNPRLGNAVCPINSGAVTKQATWTSREILVC
jgi:transposase-like protein